MTHIKPVIQAEGTRVLFVKRSLNPTGSIPMCVDRVIDSALLYSDEPGGKAKILKRFVRLMLKKHVPKISKSKRAGYYFEIVDIRCDMTIDMARASLRQSVFRKGRS